MLLFTNGTAARENTLLTLTENTPTEGILKLRYSAHIVAVALSSPSTHPYSFFKSLMTTPDRVHECYFPTCPEDLTKMAQDVMGGRW